MAVRLRKDRTQYPKTIYGFDVAFFELPDGSRGVEWDLVVPEFPENEYKHQLAVVSGGTHPIMGMRVNRGKWHYITIVNPERFGALAHLPSGMVTRASWVAWVTAFITGTLEDSLDTVAEEA